MRSIVKFLFVASLIADAVWLYKGYPKDSTWWTMLAITAGTGLIIMMSSSQSADKSGSGAGLSSNLANRMTSSNTPVFEAALTEAVSRVKSGDESGLRAIKEAIIHLSGRDDFVGFKPGTVARAGSEYDKAEDRILDLAAKEQLLKDPHATQDLISAYGFLHNAQDAARLVRDVVRVGGTGQGHAFLLLKNDMWCWVQLGRKT